MFKVIIWSVLTLIQNLLTQLLRSLVETKIVFNTRYGLTCCLNKADLLSVGSSVRSFFSTSCLISSVRSVICNQTKSHKLKVLYCIHVQVYKEHGHKKIRLYTQYPSVKTILVKKYSLKRTNVLLLKLLDNRIY